MAQDRIGDGRVEIEVRKGEEGQIGRPLEFDLATAGLEGDVPVMARIHGLAGEGQKHLLGAPDPVLQLGEAGFGVGHRDRFGAGEPRRRPAGVVGHDLHLPDGVEHVGRQPVVQKDRRIDPALGAERLALGENSGERGQPVHEDRNAVIVKGHGVRASSVARSDSRREVEASTAEKSSPAPIRPRGTSA